MNKVILRSLTTELEIQINQIIFAKAILTAAVEEVDSYRCGEYFRKDHVADLLNGTISLLRRVEPIIGSVVGELGAQCNEEETE